MASSNPSGYRHHPPPTGPPPPPPPHPSNLPIPTGSMDQRQSAMMGSKAAGGGGGGEVTNGASSQSGLGMSQVGVWCERCNTRLVELKKQALRLMIMHPSLMRLAMKVMKKVPFCLLCPYKGEI